jgi:2-methylcitrate dehydratase PrpD
MKEIDISFQKKRQLLNYYEKLQYHLLPPEVIELVKKCLLDILGCGIAGSNTESSNIVYGYAKESFPGTESSVWIDGNTLSTFGAAFVNGTMAADLDIDDGVRAAAGHPGGVIFPALLAEGERLKISPAVLIEAVVIAYDIGIRFGELIFQNTVNRFFGAGTWAIVGAAAGLSRLYNFSGKDFLNALGVAEAYAPLAPVMKSIENGSNTKEAMGWAAAAAISTASLAGKGFLGVESMLVHEEESKGYSLNDLGGKYKIIDTYFKRYTSCRWSHPSIDAFLNLRQKNSIDSQKIKKIEVFTHKKATSLNNTEPINYIQAEYSIPFALANIILYNKMGPKQLSRGNLKNKKVLEMAEKVHLIHSQEREDCFPALNTAILKIYLNDGDVIISEPTQAKGGPANPFSYQEIVTKFLWLTNGIISSKRQEAILNNVESFEKSNLTIRELLDLN